MNIWLTTDWHLYDKPKGYSFFRKAPNYGKLMEKLRELVCPGDFLIVLGDLASRQNDDATEGKANQELAFFGDDIRNLPGHKILVKGNHDAFADVEYLNLGFDDVCTCAMFDTIIFTHKPVPTGEGEINIHGHVHNERFMSIDSSHIRIPPTEDSKDPPVLELETVLQQATVSKNEPSRTNSILNADKEFCHKLSTSGDHLKNVLDFGKLYYEKVPEFPVDESIETLDELYETVYIESIHESVSIPNISTPQDLSRWMRSNIKYDHNDRSWELRSPEQVYQERKGDCHDQSLFEYSILTNLGYKCGRLFMVEYKEGSKYIYDAGATHTLCYYEDRGKLYWFENAWESNSGIHGPYNDVNSLKVAVMNTWKYSGKYDTLFIGKCGSVTPGMSLDEYVNACIPDSMIDPKFLTESVQYFNDPKWKTQPIRIMRKRPKWIESSDVETCIDIANDQIEEYRKDASKNRIPVPKQLFKVNVKPTEMIDTIVMNKLIPGGPIIKDALDLSTANFYMEITDTFRLLFITHGIGIDPTKSTVDVYLMDAYPGSFFKKLKSWKVDVSVFKRVKTNVIGESITTPADKSLKLYHGSDKKLTVLNPKVSTHGKSYVYATTDPAFAICYAGKQWDDFEISQGYINGELYLCEMQPGMFDKKFNCTGYLYELSSEGFSPLNQHEWVNTNPVTPIQVGAVNIRNELSGSGVKQYKYPELPPHIPDRAEYFYKKADELYQMTKDKKVFTAAEKAAEACGLTLAFNEVYTGDAAELHTAINNDEKLELMKKHGLRIPGHEGEEDEEPEPKKKKKKSKSPRKNRPKNEDADMTPANDHELSEHIPKQDVYGNILHNEASHANVLAGMIDIDLTEAFKNTFKKKDTGKEKDNKLYPVWVMLMHSGSEFSEFIKFMTQAPFSHSSISFDSSMTNMFTFGSKPGVEGSIGSFKTENIQTEFFQQKPIPFALYVVPVVREELKKMKDRLNFFIKNESKFKYDTIGCVKTYFGISDNPEYRYFCSRFVADILHAGKPDTPRIGDPSLIKPMDFADMPFAHFVTGGYLNEYDEKKVKKLTNQVLREEKLRLKSEAESNLPGLQESVYDIPYQNPYALSIFRYQIAGLDESALDSIEQALKSFKVRFTHDGTIIVTQREYKNLRQHFQNSTIMMRKYRDAKNIEGMKAELAKMYYISEIITHYYIGNKKVDEDTRKDMVNLRSTILNAVKGAIRDITELDPDFNFQEYYETTKYSDAIVVPKESLTAVGTAIKTLL